MFTGITHLALRVTDMDRSLSFYCDVLGLSHVFSINNEAGGKWIEYVKINDGSFLELFYGANSSLRKPYDFQRIGYHHFCLATGNIQALAERLCEKGILSKAEPTHNKDGNLGLWIEDPDGNAVEIVQYKPESPLMRANENDYDFACPGFTGFAHISYVVSDMEKALSFYENTCGFQRVLDLDDDAGEPFLIFLRIADGQFIELFYGGRLPADQGEGVPGYAHACLLCDDVVQTSASLEAKGAQMDAQPKRGGDYNMQAWISDPDANSFEIMTLDPRSPQANS